MERWQEIEYLILVPVRAARGNPKGHPAVLPTILNTIRESVPDCSSDDVSYAIDRLYRSQYLKVEIWDNSLNNFRHYQGDHEDLTRNQLWLQETPNTELYYGELQALKDLKAKKRKIGF